MVEAGQVYKHYKGTDYEVLALAKHTETLEDLVVYQDIGSPEKIWVRPLTMFTELIELNGKQQSRFTLLSTYE